MACIMNLPLEVLEEIFGLLDGKSFCTCRQVCKSWNDSIRRMETRKGIWKTFCLNDIPQKVLEEIIGLKSISLIGDIDWNSIYKKWYQSRIISNFPFSKSEIPAFLPNPITCVAVSGCFVLTGHMNGLLCVWNLPDGTLKKQSLCHLKIINGMALIDLLNLGYYLGVETQPWAHHHVITISGDQYFHVVPVLEPMTISGPDLHISCHGDDLKQIVVFGDTFAIGSRDNTISLWKMSLVRDSFRLDVTLLRMIIGPADIFMSVGFWHNEIQCVSYSGKLLTLCVDENGWIENKSFRNCTQNGCGNIINVISAYIFRSRTVMLLTADGRLIISVNDKISQYYPMRELQTCIISVAFQGPILALGGENGSLFLYYLSNEEELIKLDLSKPNFKLNVCEASIISIHISYQDYSPVIAISTTIFVQVLRWYKKTPLLRNQQNTFSLKE